MLKQLLARQVLAAPDDYCQAATPHIYLMPFAGFTTEPKMESRAVHIHVPIAHRSQAERVVLTGIFVVADADETFFQEPDNGSQDFIPRKAWQPQIPFYSRADFRQRLRKRDHAVILGFVAHFAPPRMIAMLLA